MSAPFQTELLNVPSLSEASKSPITSETVAQTVPIPVGAPLVTNITPPINTILTTNQTIGFDILSQAVPPRAFRIRVLLAQYTNIGIYEVIYDNSSFSSNYTGTIIPLANGFRFTGISRLGGWPGSPKIIPITVDVAGLINS